MVDGVVGIPSRLPTTLRLPLTPTAVSKLLTCMESDTDTMLARAEAKTTWHNIVSFVPGQNNYLKTLSKGLKVFVEANFEIREPDPNADPETPQGQRQIYLRHGSCTSSLQCPAITDTPPSENLRVIGGTPNRAQSSNDS